MVTCSSEQSLCAKRTAVARANVVWFAGGDQDRATALLITGKGKDTPFIAALRDKLKTDDLILAGYSAGAAVALNVDEGGSWAPRCRTGAACAVTPVSRRILRI